MTPQPPIAPRKSARPAMIATVLESRYLTPHLVRVVIGGAGLAHFQPSPHADSYVKLVFLPGHTDGSASATVLSAWLAPDGRSDLDAARMELAPDAQPRLRTYTVRAFDPTRGALTLDVVVHGADGLAGPWAAGAQVGDRIAIVGPGGGYSPDPAADWHLLLGDTSALPAIAVALERLPRQARGHAIIEVPDDGDRVPLDGPVGVDVRWIATGVPGGRNDATVAAVREIVWPEGRVHAFVHGEAGLVREVRRYLRMERGVPAVDLSISGYWRLGANDEAWRATKRDWTRVQDEAESAAGLD